MINIEYRLEVPHNLAWCVENPESISHAMCVAPAEGESPLNIMTDLNFEAMSNPDKLLYGTGTFMTDRPRELTYRKYFDQ